MDWSKFFSMGGYAFYVWGSYAFALLMMGGEVAFLLHRRRSVSGTDRDARQGED